MIDWTAAFLVIPIALLFFIACIPMAVTVISVLLDERNRE